MTSFTGVNILDGIETNKVFQKAISIPGICLSKDISVDLRITDQGVATYKNDSYDIFRYVWNDHSCAVTVKNQV